MTTCPDCGRRHEPERPNIAHYFRPTPRHQWRSSSVTVNASPCAVPTVWNGLGGQYADVPYDWPVWSPPKIARRLPGISPAMLAILAAQRDYEDSMDMLALGPEDVGAK